MLQCGNDRRADVNIRSAAEATDRRAQPEHSALVKLTAAAASCCAIRRA